MATLTIPTPFRPYTNGVSALEVQASNVGAAVQELVGAYPALYQHLYTEEGDLRNFVNLFLNGEDVRYLQGEETPLTAQDQLRIIPSIAGGNQISQVDQSILKTVQILIVSLCLLAFLINQPVIVGFVATAMFLGVINKSPGFTFLHKGLLERLGWVQANTLPHDPATHRFAQLLGVLFLGVLVILDHREQAFAIKYGVQIESDIFGIVKSL